MKLKIPKKLLKKKLSAASSRKYGLCGPGSWDGAPLPASMNNAWFKLCCNTYNCLYRFDAIFDCTLDTPAWILDGTGLASDAKCNDGITPDDWQYSTDKCTAYIWVQSDFPCGSGPDYHCSIGDSGPYAPTTLPTDTSCSCCDQTCLYTFTSVYNCDTGLWDDSAPIIPQCPPTLPDPTLLDKWIQQGSTCTWKYQTAGKCCTSPGQCNETPATGEKPNGNVCCTRCVYTYGSTYNCGCGSVGSWTNDDPYPAIDPECIPDFPAGSPVWTQDGDTNHWTCKVTGIDCTSVGFCDSPPTPPDKPDGSSSCDKCVHTFTITYDCTTGHWSLPTDVGSQITTCTQTMPSHTGGWYNSSSDNCKYVYNIVDLECDTPPGLLDCCNDLTVDSSPYPIPTPLSDDSPPVHCCYCVYYWNCTYVCTGDTPGWQTPVPVPSAGTCMDSNDATATSYDWRPTSNPCIWEKKEADEDNKCPTCSSPSTTPLPPTPNPPSDCCSLCYYTWTSTYTCNSGWSIPSPVGSGTCSETNLSVDWYASDGPCTFTKITQESTGCPDCSTAITTPDKPGPDDVPPDGCCSYCYYTWQSTYICTGDTPGWGPTTPVGSGTCSYPDISSPWGPTETACVYQMVSQENIGCSGGCTSAITTPNPPSSPAPAGCCYTCNRDNNNLYGTEYQCCWSSISTATITWSIEIVDGTQPYDNDSDQTTVGATFSSHPLLASGTVTGTLVYISGEPCWVYNNQGPLSSCACDGSDPTTEYLYVAVNPRGMFYANVINCAGSCSMGFSPSHASVGSLDSEIEDDLPSHALGVDIWDCCGVSTAVWRWQAGGEPGTDWHTSLTGAYYKLHLSVVINDNNCCYPSGGPGCLFETPSCDGSTCNPMP